ncbi:hypothetical protein [Streptomyces sp. CAU 1734]|uniref:hypothetical protein n=1 Tax=Streptomyces sp. CAU 1734 TaxID=3140360 RepID=UPI0032602A53
MVTGRAGRAGRLMLLVALLFGIATMHTVGHPEPAHATPGGATSAGAGAQASVASGAGPAVGGAARAVAAGYGGPVTSRPLPDEAGAGRTGATGAVPPMAGHHRPAPAPDPAPGQGSPAAVGATGTSHTNSRTHPAGNMAAMPRNTMDRRATAPVPGAPGAGEAAQRAGGVPLARTVTAGHGTHRAVIAPEAAGAHTAAYRAGEERSGGHGPGMNSALLCLAVLGASGALLLLVIGLRTRRRDGGRAPAGAGTGRRAPWPGAPPPRTLLTRLSVLRI